MDKVKEAFQKVREDMYYLNNEVNSLREEMSKISEILLKLVENKENSTQKEDKYLSFSSTQTLQNSTVSTHSSTHQHPFKPLKAQNLAISTGNQGVPTDRQTDRQTNRHTPISYGTGENSIQQGFHGQTSKLSDENFVKIEEYKNIKDREQSHEQSDKDQNQESPSIDEAAKIFDSLDGIKKELRFKFKRLTEQEMLVFTTLYQLDEENGFTDYRALSQRIGLTESSIRDYIGRLIKKKIPVEKKRVHNKFIHLKVSDNLKKIASLPTILQLRGI